MMAALPVDPTGSIMGMVVRIIDMTIVLMLVPVILLYLQYLRAKAQESLTFALTMGGLIFSLLSTYVFQLAMRVPLAVIRTDYYQQGSVLDALYIFGYLMIVVGLYASMKYDEWGFMAIERALK